MEAAITKLSGMNAAEVTTLAENGINSQNEDDLCVLSMDHIMMKILPDATLGVSSKLARIATFIACGNEIDETTTIARIMVSLNGKLRCCFCFCIY